MKKLILVHNGSSRGQAYRALVDGFVHQHKLSNEVLGLYVKPYELNAFNSPLLDKADQDAVAIGKFINSENEQLEAVIYAPTRRARETVAAMESGCKELGNIPWINDERVIGQNFGDAYDKGGLQTFFALSPKERVRFEKVGIYDYVFPHGESLAHTYERARTWVQDTLVKYAHYECVYVISDENFFVCVRGVVEKWDRETFLRIFQDQKLQPRSCAMTRYCDRGNGLSLDFHNRKATEVNNDEESAI